MTVNEFQNCVKVFGFGTPSASIAQAFIDEAEADGSISTKLEAYMAVAQMSWESAGFTARNEWDCSGGLWSNNTCGTYDKVGCPTSMIFFNQEFFFGREKDKQKIKILIK